MDIDIASLEQATLDAVAPAEWGSLPGWLLPFDRTTIGRATSAVPLRHDDLAPRDLDAVEARYAERKLQARFRIADVDGLAVVHESLHTRGYRPSQPTWTMVGRIRDWISQAPDTNVQISEEPSPAWESVYLAEDFDPVDGANRIKALSRSRSLVYAHLMNAAGDVVAAGTASFSQGWASLHGMRTVGRERGKGHARRLIDALGREALARGLERGFLQVDEDNTGAVRLYRSLGLEAAWLYRYWRKCAQPPG